MNPEEHYKKNQLHYIELEKKFKDKSTAVAWLRLAVFIGLCLFVYFLREHTEILISGIALLIVLFGWLVKRNSVLNDKAELYQVLAKINEREQKVLHGKYDEFDAGENFQDAGHHYSNDLDLFGDRSLFQYLNRSVTEHGKAYLAEHLNTNHTNPDEINRFKELVRELAPKLEWRQKLQAISRKSFKKKKKKKYSKTNQIQASIPAWFHALKFIIPLLSIGFTVLLALDIIYFQHYVMLLVLPFTLYGAFVLKKANFLHYQYGNLEPVIKQQLEIIKHLEEIPLESTMIKEDIQRLFQDDDKISGELNTFVSQFSNLEQRSSFLLSILLNLFLSWDIHWLQKLEKWHKKNEVNIPQWSKFIGKIEAFSSLANYGFNHPDYVYGETGSQYVLDVEQLGHPLLFGERILNDYRLGYLKEIHIVTGANMAGKSTFLRAIGVNLVLARCGAPVCAKRFEFTPLELYSGMRTDDSLQDGASYFFSELRRLGKILDELRADKQVFILLDEILKGTNSKDKEEGSRKYIESLLKYEVVGLVATHDLALCEMEKTYPDNIKNKSFEVEFQGDELIFDYKLKSGPCKTMNASFLMKKLNLIE